MARNITTKDLKLFKKLQDRDIKQQIGKPLNSNVSLNFIYGNRTFIEPHLDREITTPANMLAFLEEYNGKQIYAIISDKTENVDSTEIATLWNGSEEDQIAFNLNTTHGTINVTFSDNGPIVDWSQMTEFIGVTTDATIDLTVGDTSYFDLYIDGYDSITSIEMFVNVMNLFNRRQIATFIGINDDQFVAETAWCWVDNYNEKEKTVFLDLATTHGAIGIAVSQVSPEEGDPYLSYQVDWSRASFETSNKNVNSKYLTSISTKLGHNIYPINKIIDNDNGTEKTYDPQELQEANFDSELYLRDDKFMTVILPSDTWSNTTIEIRSLDETTLCVLDLQTNYIFTEGNDGIILQLMIKQGRKTINPQEVIIYISHLEE